MKSVLSLIGLTLLLAGCQPAATVKPVVEDPGRQIAAREATLSALDGFTVSGGLGIWTDEETMSARMAWREAAENLSLTLVAPLGLGTLDLYRDERGTTLKRGTAIIGKGGSADQVLQQGLALERPIPLEQISAWLRGLPGAGRKIQRDTHGRIQALEYRDSDGVTWRARFLKYTKLDGLELPVLISANGGPYNVRLKLRDWVLASAEGLDTPSEKRPENGNSSRRLAIPGQ